MEGSPFLQGLWEKFLSDRSLAYSLKSHSQTQGTGLVMLRDPMSDVGLISTWMNLTHRPDGIRTCSEAGIHIPDTFLGTVSWAAWTPHAFE